MPALTKPLIVPDYNGKVIRLYTPDPVTGEAVSPDPNDTANVQAVLDRLFVGQGRHAAPNVCILSGTDLFVAQSSDNSQAILKFPGFLKGPKNSEAAAFAYTLVANDYVGLAIDAAAGNLYSAEGNFRDNQIVRYTGLNAPFNGPGLTIGNGGLVGDFHAYFGDLVFDHAGNLWAADYNNHRVVVFDAAGLGTTNTFHVLTLPQGTYPVATTDPALNASTTHLFSEPEGVDFDTFGPGANLWVGNNNDGLAGAKTTLTSLVKITPALQALVLATPSGATIDPARVQPNVNCFIYQVPNGAGGTPQFGGVQVDKATNRLYVNEEIDGNVRVYDLAHIATIGATAAALALTVLPITTSKIQGNGGMAMLQLGAFMADTAPDTATDTGLEPSTSYDCWSSLAISPTQNDQGSLTTLPSPEMVLGGQPCSVYVLVQNFAPTATLGIETLDLRWGKASTGLGWPQPWDGTTGVRQGSCMVFHIGNNMACRSSIGSPGFGRLRS